MAELLLESPELAGIRLNTDRRFAAIRREISDTYYEATVLDQKGACDEEVNNKINGIAFLPGLQMIEERNFRSDVHFRCAEFVFGDVRQEGWAQLGWTVKTTPTFWRFPFAFLHMANYELVREPEPGDIVGYGGVHMGEPWMEHYGIYSVNGEVLSKFGRGPIVAHHLDLIASSPEKEKGHWGDRYWLFRKTAS